LQEFLLLQLQLKHPNIKFRNQNNKINGNNIIKTGIININIIKNIHHIIFTPNKLDENKLVLLIIYNHIKI